MKFMINGAIRLYSPTHVVDDGGWIKLPNNILYIKCSTVANLPNSVEYVNVKSLNNTKIGRLDNLRYLRDSYHRGITSLEFLKESKNLEYLSLNFSDLVKSLKPLEGFTNLKQVRISRVIENDSLKYLTKSKNLQLIEIRISGDRVTLEPLSSLKNLKVIKIKNRINVDSLGSLLNSKQLREIALSTDDTKLTNVLRNFGHVSTVNLVLPNERKYKSLIPELEDLGFKIYTSAMLIKVIK